MILATATDHIRASYRTAGNCDLRDQKSINFPGRSCLIFVKTKTTDSNETRQLGKEFADRQNGSLQSVLNDHLVKLDGFRQLEEGWDGYEAQRPSDLAIGEAKEYLCDLYSEGLLPQRVAPSVANGIGITHKQDGCKVYVEILNDGSAYCLLSDSNSDPEIFPIGLSPESRKEHIFEVRAHLGI